MGKISTLFLLFIAVGIGYIIKSINDAGSLGEWIVSFVPYVPSHWLQNSGSYSLNVFSNMLLPFLKTMGFFRQLKCSNTTSDDQLVIVAVNKGGSILSSQICYELITGCGLSVSMGGKVDEGWPPKVEKLPTYDADVYLVPGHGLNWPEYAYRINPKTSKPKEVRCVVLTRDPFDRLFSLYKYSWDAGESGLRQRSRDMKSLKTLEERVQYMWNEYGKGSLEVTHETLMKSLSGEYDCIQVKADDLFKGGDSFDAAAKRMLKKWNMLPDVIPTLVKRFQKHDLSRQPKEKVENNEHVSGRSISKEEKNRIKNLMMQDRSIMAVIAKQRKDLKY